MRHRWLKLLWFVTPVPPDHSRFPRRFAFAGPRSRTACARLLPLCRLLGLLFGRLLANLRHLLRLQRDMRFPEQTRFCALPALVDAVGFALWGVRTA